MCGEMYVNSLVPWPLIAIFSVNSLASHTSGHKSDAGWGWLFSDGGGGWLGRGETVVVMSSHCSLNHRECNVCLVSP